MPTSIHPNLHLFHINSTPPWAIEMRTNKDQALSTPKVLLVPYEPHHVPLYHTWMQDPALQAATASEPLTLEEEHAMQETWRTDRDKLTFIICLPCPSADSVTAGEHDTDDRMVGDINLFLYDVEVEQENTATSPSQPPASTIGEIELMIARKETRRKGYGRAALMAFMTYIVDEWAGIAGEYTGRSDIPPLAYLRVKIDQSNEGSMALFRSVGFEEVGSSPNYFGEWEMRLSPDGVWMDERPRRLKYVRLAAEKNG